MVLRARNLTSKPYLLEERSSRSLILLNSDMGEELTRKKRVRGGHKASATRLVTKVEEMVASEGPADPFKLSQLGMNIKEKLEDIKVLDAEILKLVGEGELEGEIAEADLFKEKIYFTLILIERASGRASQSNTVTSAALPTTAVPTLARGSRARLRNVQSSYLAVS